jgi:outer membrane protein OmpA-like peptidoglycan-associated protein
MNKTIYMSMIVSAGVVVLLAGCCPYPVYRTRPVVVMQAPPMQQEMPAPMVENRHETLGADALFAFGRFDINSLTGRGRSQLDRLVAELHEARSIHTVDLVGYTDRIGNRAQNDDLSLRRANAVRDYLVGHGVDAGVITTEGRGDADPVVACPNLTGQQLRDCLAPNRRVEVNIQVLR